HRRSRTTVRQPECRTADDAGPGGRHCYQGRHAERVSAPTRRAWPRRYTAAAPATANAWGGIDRRTGCASTPEVAAPRYRGSAPHLPENSVHRHYPFAIPDTVTALGRRTDP